MTKILGIGEAIYLEGTSIQISRPDDWGWFYRSSDGDYLVIQVRKNIFGKYKPVIPADINQNIQVSETDITDLKVDDRKNGLPDAVSARIKIGNKRVHAHFQRISLKRYDELATNGDVKEAMLESHSGYFPSLLIFMLGATSSGKTCWLHALNTRSIRDKVLRQRHINYFGQEQNVVERLDPTKLTKIKFNKFFLRRGKKIQALVFIVDLAGEVNDLNQEDKDYVMLRESIREYASGIFVVKNGKSLLKHETVQHDPGEFILLDLLQDDNGLDEDKFCYILTCVDKIQEIIKNDTGKQDEFDLTPDCPIFRSTDSSLEQMYENMAIASYIMKDRIIGDSPCFAVSCCSDTGTTNEETGKEFLDFGNGYNSDLPLVYMLKKLVKIK